MECPWCKQAHEVVEEFIGCPRCPCMLWPEPLATEEEMATGWMRPESEWHPQTESPFSFVVLVWKCSGSPGDPHGHVPEVDLSSVEAW